MPNGNVGLQGARPTMVLAIANPIELVRRKGRREDSQNSSLAD